MRGRAIFCQIHFNTELPIFISIFLLRFKKKTYIFVIRFQPISVMKQAGSGFYFLYGVKAYYLSSLKIANF